MDEELRIKQKISPIEPPRIDIEESVGIESSSYFSDQMVQVKSKKEPAPQEITIPILEKPTEEALKKKMLNSEEIRTILSKNTRLKVLLDQFLALTGNNLDECIIQLQKNLPSDGLEPNLATQAVSDAMVKVILQAHTAVDSSKQSELEGLLDQVKINRLISSHSELRILIKCLKNEQKQAGEPITEAEGKAENQALQMVQVYLEETFDKNLQTASSLEVQEAIDSIITKKFPTFDPNISLGLFTGISGAYDLSSAFFNRMEKVAHIQPTELDVQNAVQTFSTLMNEANELVTGAQSMMLNTPPPVTNEEKEEMMGFLQELAQLMSSFSAYLLQMQMSDAKRGHEVSSQERTLIKENFTLSMENLVKHMETLEKSKLLNSLGPVLGGLLGFFSAALAVVFMPVTGGASLALLAGVSVTLFATTTALSATGVLEKGFSKLSELIDKSMEGKDMYPGLKAFCKGMAYLGMIVAVVAVSAMARGGGSSLVTRLLANMICTQVVTQVMANSNVVGIFSEAVGKGIGLDEQAIMIMTTILTVIAMVGVGGASLRALKSDLDFAKTLNIVSPIIAQSTLFQKIASIMQGTAFALQGSSAIVQGVLGIVVGKAQLDEKEMEALIDLVKYMQKVLSEMSVGLQTDSDNFNQLKTMITDLLNNAMKGAQRNTDKILA